MGLHGGTVRNPRDSIHHGHRNPPDARVRPQGAGLTMALQDDILLYRRRRTILVLLALIFTAFFARLIQLQILYFEELGKKSEENSVRTIPREPVRGYIFDRFGRLV